MLIGGAAAHEAAESARRLKGWTTTDNELNTLIRNAGTTLLQRSRHLIATNGYAVNAQEGFAAHLVGAGIKPSSMLEQSDQREALHELWKRWTEECDADGRTDFYGLQHLAGLGLFEAGEIFVRIRPRRPSAQLPVPFQLQLLEAEMLDPTYGLELPNGNVIRNGIELNKIGRRQAYWFWKQHPGDKTLLTGHGTRVRVPARNVLHIFQAKRAGQLRGVPRTLQALIKLYLLDIYDDAELDRKKIAALHAGFITRPDTEEPIGNEEDTDEDGIATAAWQPGTMQILLPGEDVKFSDPADVGGNYELFQYRTLTQIAASMGLPYFTVTGDMLKANYSNTRNAMLEFRRRIGPIQQHTLIPQFCRPIWRYFINQGELAGALPKGIDSAAAADKVKWIVPKWDWVDPLKERQAEALAVEKGFKSRSDVVEAEGYDPEEMDQRIANDKEREQRLGLNFAPATKGADEDDNQPDVDEDEEEEGDEADTIPDNVRRLLP